MKTTKLLLSFLLLSFLASCGDDKKNNTTETVVFKPVIDQNENKDQIVAFLKNDNITTTGETGIKIIALKDKVFLIKEEAEFTDAEMDNVITLNVYHTNESGIKPKKLAFNMIDVLGDNIKVDGIEYYVAELEYPYSENISVLQVGQYNLKEKKSLWNKIVSSKKIQK